MGKIKQRPCPRTTWPNWNGGVPPNSLFEEMSPGRAPAYCINCDEWFVYAWGYQGLIEHRKCRERNTFAY